jgi:uroporphyrinogen-III synthase
VAGLLLIVTRPAAQAAPWVQALHALGQKAAALPLIEIGPPEDTAAVHTAWAGLGGDALVMFVSANAVQHFFALAPAGLRWPPGLRAACTGPGTAAALRAAGVPAAQVVQPPDDAASFDSETLWALLAHEDWAGRRVRVVRGEEGRDWLAETLRGRGATVEFVAAYRRHAPVLDSAGAALLAQALAAPAAHLWVFSSSEAVGHLATLAPQARWNAARALASHPRIAQAAQDLGFGQVRLLPAPTPAAVAAAAQAEAGPSIESAPS